ncbi:MAG: hypothetical protein ABI843_02900 [Dokdonella sp.]
MTQHETLVAYDEEGNPRLWDVRTLDGQFVCRIWRLTHEEVATLAHTKDASFLHNKLPLIGEFYDIGGAYRFFADENDPILAASALQLFNRIEPDWAP